MAQEVSQSLKDLAAAIRAHPNPVQVALCGFDLWVEVLGSGHAKGCDFVPGGRIATAEDADNALKVPVMTIGKSIVVSFDPTLPPDGYLLKP